MGAGGRGGGGTGDLQQKVPADEAELIDLIRLKRDSSRSDRSVTSFLHVDTGGHPRDGLTALYTPVT